MSIGLRYDTRLIAYQGLLEIPLQVLMYDVYKKLDPNFTTYATMSLLNLGAWALNHKISTQMYYALHNTAPQKNTPYYVSFMTEYNYNHLKNNTDKIPISDRAEYTKKVDAILKQAPAYTQRTLDLQMGAYALKSAYGALVKYNQSKNAIGSLAYGLTQPLAVILKDAKAK
jgi:hypothetical protein